MKRRLVNVLLLVVSLALALAAGEFYLRRTGFSYHPYLTEVQFGWPDPDQMNTGGLHPDANYIWSSDDLKTAVANSLKAPPAIVFTGDSCTAFSGYFNEFGDLYQSEHPGQPIGVVGLAVPGWSSYQGLELLKRDIRRLRPKIATFYYGWNDHWASFGIEDKEIRSISFLTHLGLEDIRLVQLLAKTMARFKAPRSDRFGPNRVSIVDYEHNLAEIVRISNEAGIFPVLVTAPSSHVEGNEPEYLRWRWLRNLSDLVPLHRAYNNVVRTVAAANPGKTALCDMERVFAELPEAERNSHFAVDGIHFSLEEGGSEFFARQLYGCFRQQGIFEYLK